MAQSDSKEFEIGISLAGLHCVREQLLAQLEADCSVDVLGTTVSLTWDTLQTRHVFRLLKKKYAEQLKTKTLAELCHDGWEASPTAETMAMIAKPTHFVSHVREYLFKDFLAVLEQFVEEGKTNEKCWELPTAKSTENAASTNDGASTALEDKTMFFWIDEIVVNQDSTRNKPNEWWKNTFQAAIGEIKHVVAIFHPWNEPRPLQRTWCLWELYSTQLTAAKLHIRMPPKDNFDFIDALITDFGKISASLQQIDLERAECRDPAAKGAIATNVKEGLGFRELNQMVKLQLTNWLCLQCQLAITRLQQTTHTPETEDQEIQLRLQTGRLLRDVGEVDTSKEILQGALEILRKRHSVETESPSVWWAHLSSNSSVVNCLLELMQTRLRANDKELCGEFEDLEALVSQIEDKEPLARVKLAHALALQDLKPNVENARLKFLELVELIDTNTISTQLSTRCLMSYSRLLRYVGGNEEAVKRGEDALAKAEPKSELYIQCCGSLATAYKNLGRAKQTQSERNEWYQKALEKFVEAFHLRRELSGDIHLDTVKALHGFAKMLFEMDHVEAAEFRCDQARTALAKRMEAYPQKNSASTIAEALDNEVAITIAKIFAWEGNYEKARQTLSSAVAFYESTDDKGALNPKTWNAKLELARVLRSMGDPQAIPLLQEAWDNLKKCGLDDTHEWIRKSARYLQSAYSTERSTQPTRRALVVDCGSYQTKAILCTLENGVVSTREMDRRLPAILDFLRDQRERFADQLVSWATKENASVIYVGLSAWYRNATEAEKSDTQDVINRACDKTILQTFKLIALESSEEASYELTAVNYAAERCGLPPVDVLLGSGGGSVQISANGLASLSIPSGFREAQHRLMEEGVDALDAIDAEWEQRTTDSLESNNFQVQPNANVVAISACYFAAEDAGINEQQLLCGAVVDCFTQARNALKDTLISSGAKMEMDDARKLANWTVQIKLFSKLVHSDSTVRFGREWMVDGKPFRTTWAAGWFLKQVQTPTMTVSYHEDDAL